MEYCYEEYSDDIISTIDDQKNIVVDPVMVATSGSALLKTDAPIEESLMIGDMFDTDIAGAANFGIDSIYYNPKGKTGHPFAPTYEVRHLLEIKETGITIERFERIAKRENFQILLKEKKYYKP